MQGKPTTAEIVIIASGAVALVFSFLDWLDFAGTGANAWESGFFPTYTLVGILGAAMAVVVALEAFAGTKLPRDVFGFTWPQIHLALGVYTALLSLSFLIVDKGGADMGIGFFLSLLASAGLVVGAVMLRNERPGGVRQAPAGGGGGGGAPPGSGAPGGGGGGQPPQQPPQPPQGPPQGPPQSPPPR